MIDLNRGVTKRFHSSGVAVCMYKDAPGVYLDTAGNELNDKIAAEAGFPVDAYAKERQRRDRMAAAMKEINEEFGNIPEGKPVFTVGNYSVVHKGGGSFVVQDEDNTVLTPVAMEKSKAIQLARKMAANEKVDEPKPKPEAKNGETA